MRKHRIILTALLFFSALMGLNALSIEDILSAANNVSYTVKNAELTHQNSLLLIEQNDLDDKPIWTVETTIVPISKSDLSTDRINISTLRASLELPNDGATTISVNAPMAATYNGDYTISPTASVSHKFDFNYFDEDQITDLNNAISEISTERIYNNAIYSFNKTVISLVSNLLTIEKNIEEAEYNISTAERDLNNALTLRSVSENSVSYRRSLLELEMSRRSLENYQDQYEKAKNQFTISTGLVWDGLDDFSLPELNLPTLENGNSEVLEYMMTSQMRNLEVEQKEKELDPRSMTLTGSVGGRYSTSSGINSGTAIGVTNNGVAVYSSSSSNTKDNINGSVGLSFNLSDWSFGATFNASVNPDDWSLSPTLTLTGAWRSNTTREKDRLELQRLRNTAISAQNEYLDKLTTFNINNMNLDNQIMNYSFTLSNLDQNEEYLMAVLESEKEFYDAGLVSIDDVNDAQFNYDMARYDRLITHLEGLSLYYDILIQTL